MGDDWLTEMEMETQPVVTEETDIDLIGPGQRAELFASGVSEDLQPNLLVSAVSEEISGSFLQRSRRFSNRHSSSSSLGSMQGR